MDTLSNNPDMLRSTRTLGAVRGKLIAEEARNLSDAEIERCLCNCQIPSKMILVAKEWRDEGLLTI